MELGEFMLKFPGFDESIASQLLEKYNKFNPIGKPAFATAYNLYGTQLISNDDPLMGWLKLDFSSGRFSDIWGILVSVKDALIAVGAILVVLYFLLELVEKVTAEQLTPETLIRLFIKLLVGELFIQNCTELMIGGLGFANDILDAVNSDVSMNGYSTYMVKIADRISEQKLLESFGMLFEMWIPGVIMQGTKIIVSLVILSRAVELGLRAAFAPIAMADIFESGLRSNGFKYFKKFIAVGLQGALIIAVIKVANAVQSAIIVDVTEPNFLLTVAVALTAITMLQRTQNWANEIMGVS